MKKYIGSNGSEFILTNVGIGVNVGDVIAPIENTSLKVVVKRMYDNGIAATLQTPDTFIPDRYFGRDISWKLTL